MNKVLKNIVNGAIENEFDRVDLENVIKSNEYKEWSEKQDKARKKLFEIIPKEYHEEFNKALDDYENMLWVMVAIDKLDELNSKGGKNNENQKWNNRTN